MQPLVTVDAFTTKYLQRAVDPDAAAWALDVASGQVRDHCGWSISAETTTFMVDGSGTSLLTLPTLLLTDVYEVRVRGRVIDQAPLNGRPTGGEYVWSRRGQLFRAVGWPEQLGSVEVDAEHGYIEVPATVAIVVCGLAEAALPNHARELASKTVGAVTHTYRDTSGAMTVVQASQLSGYTL